MPRVVIDTSVVVSAMLKKDGTSRKALTKASAECVFLFSNETLIELAEVLNRSKFEKFFSEEEKLAAIDLIIEKGEAIEVTSALVLCRDTSDDKFLNLAVDGKADAIVSRDPDLLILESVNAIPILNPATFLTWLASKES